MNKKEEREYYETQPSEQVFLDWYKTIEIEEYEKPSVTVDNVILAYDKTEEAVKMLMIKRKKHPFINCWALPGGFVDSSENTTEAVIREVKEETNVDITENQLEQLYTFSQPNRDPRHWVITVAHMTFLPFMPSVTALDDASDYMWFTIDSKEDSFTLTGSDGTFFKLDSTTKQLDNEFNTNLSFDHNEIIWQALTRIRGSLDWTPNILKVLGDTFTLVEARKVYSQFLPVSFEKIDHSNFKKTHAKPLFEYVESIAKGVGRPSNYYRLKNYVK